MIIYVQKGMKEEYEKAILNNFPEDFKRNLVVVEVEE